MAETTHERQRQILVAGGAGFLGSHLCELLLAEGHAVVCLDNFRTGARDNVRHLAGSRDFRIFEADVTEPVAIDADQIYNLACPASPQHYQSDPIFTTKTNVLGALNLLELSRRTGARILQASTSEVYGDPLVHPQTEAYWGNVNPNGLRSCYDEGKRCAESLFLDFHRRHKVVVKIARIFNTYGPRMHQNDGRVVSNFIVQALTGQPITVYGDGSQTRSLCYVDDLVDALRRLMNSDRAETGPVNVGNPHEVRVLAVARMVKDMTGSRSPIIFRQLPADDPRMRRPDITEAERLLGWSPTTSLEAGLRRTIDYFEWQLRAAARRQVPAARRQVVAVTGFGRPHRNAIAG